MIPINNKKTNIYFALATVTLFSAAHAAVIRDTTVQSNSQFDLDGDGELEFSIGGRPGAGAIISTITAPLTTQFCSEFVFGEYSRLFPVSTGMFIGPDSAGTIIGTDPVTFVKDFVVPEFPLAMTTRSQGEPDDGVFVGRTAALGFRFQRDGNTHYGYALLTDVTATAMTVLETAWEDQPDTAIRVIPEPSTVVLSMSAIWLGLRRKRDRRF